MPLKIGVDGSKMANDIRKHELSDSDWEIDNVSRNALGISTTLRDSKGDNLLGEDGRELFPEVTLNKSDAKAIAKHFGLIK